MLTFLTLTLSLITATKLLMWWLNRTAEREWEASCRWRAEVDREWREQSTQPILREVSNG